MTQRSCLLCLLVCVAVHVPVGLAETATESATVGTPVETRIRALLGGANWPAGLREARQLVADAPEDPLARSLLGQALLRAGRPAQAYELLVKPAGDDGLPAAGHVTLGRIQAARGRLEEALDHFERALTVAPDDPDALFWSAETAPSRAASIALLERYLEVGKDEDPDRLEAARGAVRLYRSLGEREIWVPVSRPERIELPLEPAVDEQSRLLGYVVVAKLGKKGKPVRLLLDSGSTGLFLVGRIARKRGLESLTEETTFGGGGKGRRRDARGLIALFDLGGLSFADALVTTTEQELEPHGRFHGVLGLQIFEGYRVTLDLPERRLLLEPPGEAFKGADYWMFSGQMLTYAEAAGGNEGMFLLDTGATSTLLSVRFAESIGGARLDRPVNVRGYGGVHPGARAVQGAELFFQGRTTGADGLQAIDLDLRGKMGAIEVSGYLGLDLLDGTRIVVDTTRRRVLVETP